jgi:transcription antitermination factor NusG
MTTNSTPKKTDKQFSRQEYLHPINIFNSNHDNREDSHIWTCVNTRPRWEKRFTRWLMSENFSYFMPTYEKTTISHRKKRTTILPLFPGYVFVIGDHTKSSFIRSGAVVRVLNMRSAAGNAEINNQLKSIWLMGINNLQMSPVVMPQKGENIEILDGPLKGTIGNFVKKGRQNCLIIEINMLETGVEVELPPEYRFRIV